MNKIALITGAYKGLGLETSFQLGQKGHTIIVASRNLEKSREAAGKLTDKGIGAHGVKLDVTSSDDIENLRRYIAEEFGKLDVLVNNAGVHLDFPTFMPGNSSETVSMKSLKDSFEINFFAPVILTQKLLPLIKKSESGRIVNVSSIMGSLNLHSDPNSPIYGIKPLAYDATKAALNQFTIHLAEALKDTRIKVNSVHPGWVKTDIGGDYAPMSVEEGAKSIVDTCLLDEQGISGGFIHQGESIPW